MTSRKQKIDNVVIVEGGTQIKVLPDPAGRG